jgi:transcriptional regulator with XRE-family HTH domain
VIPGVYGGRSNDLRSAWPALATELKRFREAADLSTRQLATQLKWSQGKVHKVENGHTLPSAQDVQAWLEATGAPAHQEPQLLNLAERAHHEAILIRAARRAGLVIDLPELQRQVREAEQTARTIRVYSPILIPGLLQTPDYARGMVLAAEPDNPTVAAAIADRMQRQAILYEPGRRFEFVVGETALRWRFGPAAVQVAQLRQLHTFTTLVGVLIGILPLDRETPVWHGTGFTLFENRADDADPFVHLEALRSFENIAEPSLVERYQQVFDRLRALAIVDSEAREMIEQIMGEFYG